MKFAIINHNVSGDNTLIAAIPGKRIKVLQYTAGCDQNADIYFKSGNTRITGPIFFAASTSISSSYGAGTPAGLVPLFETAPGEALVMNINGAKTIGGHITYIVID